MKTLHLYGALAEKFGPTFDLDVATAQEAVHAVATQFPEFREIVRQGVWHVLRGPLEAQDDLGEEDVTMSLGASKEVHLLPAVVGAGGNGGMQMVLGAVMIVVGVIMLFTPAAAYGPSVIAAGVGMLAGGIIASMTKIPGIDDKQESVDDKQSFLFNGPTNTSSQGAGVPRGYGRVFTGSIVVSAALYAEDIAV